MRQEEEERQTEFYRVLGRLLDQMIQKRRQEERSRRVDEAIRPPPAEPERSSGDAGAERKTDESKTGPSEQWVNRTEKKNACERRSFWIHAEIRLILQPDNR